MPQFKTNFEFWRILLTFAWKAERNAIQKTKLNFKAKHVLSFSDENKEWKGEDRIGSW